MPYMITYKDEASPHLSHTHVYYEMVYVREGEVAMTIQGGGVPCEGGQSGVPQPV